jgi:hypothetical protein
MDPSDLLFESTPSVVADANGNATFTFNAPEAGWAWSGTIVIAALPPTIVVPAAASWTVLVGPAFWGNYTGGASAQVQARGATTVSVLARGLTVGQTYQCIWNGEKAPVGGTPFLYPFPAAPTSAVSLPFFKAVGTSVSGLGTIALSPPAGIITGDLLVATIASVSGTVSAPAGGWVGGPTAGSGTTDLTVFAKQSATGDPASWTFGPGGLVGVSGAILAYGGSHGFALGGLGAASDIAPSATQWGTNSLMMELYAQSTAVSIVISTNVNNPTTRLQISSAEGSLLVVDFTATKFGTAWSGDIANLSVCSISQPLT